MDYGESNVMGRMGCTFPIGFICDKGPATTAMLGKRFNICSVQCLIIKLDNLLQFYTPDSWITFFYTVTFKYK
jgi:hypothetical protein